MKKIKYLLYCIIAMALMPGCNGKTDSNEDNKNDSINTQLEDSLATASAEKDSLLALMDEINEGMLQIKQMQDIVSVQDLSRETPDRKQQLRTDMAAIQQAIAERQQKLAELERRLSQSNNYNDKMKRTIEGLKAQLESQQAIIDDLNKQLAAAHIEIQNLNSRVDSLGSAVNTEREQKKAVQEENARLTDDVNTLNNCYYAIGSNKELKAHKIIEKKFLGKTRIMEGDYEKSYFTKADKRTLTEIDLHSNKVKLWSRHPEGSYSIADTGSGKKLIITNPTRFWEQSNYLVVQIN